MSLSTEQMTKLAKHCGWRQAYVLDRDYYQDAPGAARGSYTEAVAKDNTPSSVCALDFTLTLAGERVVIEKLHMRLVKDVNANKWLVEWYGGKDGTRLTDYYPTLSQAIEAAVKAWLKS